MFDAFGSIYINNWSFLLANRLDKRHSIFWKIWFQRMKKLLQIESDLQATIFNFIQNVGSMYLFLSIYFIKVFVHLVFIGFYVTLSEPDVKEAGNALEKDGTHLHLQLHTQICLQKTRENDGCL